MDKRVSVVMTTYNGQKYLREQMDSLREQTMPIDEVIIMDDCSTDHTPDLVSAYIKEYDLKGWNLVQNEQNQGWKKNFKSGFDLATGNYIFPCDQDDIWHLDKVEKMVECMENNPKIELLAANYETFFSEKDEGHGSKLYAAKSKAMKSDGSIEMLGIDPKWPYINRPGCVFCFTKTFYESISDKWDTKYPHDAILWRFARMDHALALLNYPVIDFRRHGDNATSDAIWTKESRIQTFDVYIYFHKIAIERVRSGEDKKILLTGINVLEKRKRFLETGNILILIELIIKYHAFYNSIKGCLRDLLLFIENNRKERVGKNGQRYTEKSSVGTAGNRKGN